MTDQPTPPTPENPFPMPQNSVPQSTGIPPVEDVLDSTVAATPNRGKRGLLIGGAVAAVAVVGAGAYAVTSFLGGGADVAEALPADTLGYISIDLDPGGKQQVEAFRTLKKFPGIKDALNEGLPDDFCASSSSITSRPRATATWTSRRTSPPGWARPPRWGQSTAATPIRSRSRSSR